MKTIDLSMPLEHGSLSYPGDASGVSIERVEVDVPGITVSMFGTYDPHCGTHLDAPLHFVPAGDDVAEMPLIVPEIVVISSRESPIPQSVLRGYNCLEGKAVLFLTGWECHAGTRQYFEGFPVLSQALAEQLVTEGVSIVGLDTPSIDCPESDYPVHRHLLSAGIPIVEGLVNLAALLDELESGCTARLASFPLRIHGLEGSPVRAVALVE